MKNLLLHVCCAPCANSALKTLNNEFNISFYWHNPNIFNFEEYSNRKNAAINFAKENGFDFFEDETFVYDYEKWKAESHEVCLNCYEIRLNKLKAFACQKGFDYFSTSLLSSPYQKHDLIIEICKKLEKESSSKFLYRDFRKFFYEGKNALKAKGYYIQKYCACNKSYKERFAKKLDEN
ncbi:MAG: epoxyqueuosine reductase QueH [Elusimicrobiota bacterium]|nr:epoxyqueuosine reductase QueH [Elusimicrobiota bacterium]